MLRGETERVTGKEGAGAAREAGPEAHMEKAFNCTAAPQVHKSLI